MQKSIIRREKTNLNNISSFSTLAIKIKYILCSESELANVNILILGGVQVGRPRIFVYYCGRDKERCTGFEKLQKY